MDEKTRTKTVKVNMADLWPKLRFFTEQGDDISGNPYDQDRTVKETQGRFSMENVPGINPLRVVSIKLPDLSYETAGEFLEAEVEIWTDAVWEEKMKGYSDNILKLEALCQR